MKEPILKLEGLKTHFFTSDGIAKAVDGVNLELFAGETLGLVGESGCGKTVTGLSILRLVPEPPGRIVGGRVLFEGRDLLSLAAEEMRKVRGNKISMIFQEPMTSLNPVFTIGNQIVEVLTLHRGLRKREAWEQATELLERVGIPDPQRRVKEYPHQLSGGMRQRAMIAMALACNPKVLIADEPTTALDVTIQAEILELIHQLQEELNTAVMLITHDLAVIAQTAHRVAVMYAGKIVEKAGVRDLFGSPKHPYTQELLKSLPRLDIAEEPKKRLHEISGAVPNLLALPTGCYFHPRCPRRIDICFHEEPLLLAVNGEQEAACWVAQQEAARGQAIS